MDREELKVLALEMGVGEMVTRKKTGKDWFFASEMTGNELLAYGEAVLARAGKPPRLDLHASFEQWWTHGMKDGEERADVMRQMRVTWDKFGTYEPYRKDCQDSFTSFAACYALIYTGEFGYA
ncbi:hypothetical protein H1O16_gp360 [Burkholderia phage BcepSaruman]|uniref:Uncharacterized protein n=1 Tax=Burkholderia phage BcepSaruman TaxID=2530032 RepID=A0A4D5ZCK5_9CAUD|nr:hypothetical protein H1O16_gp360 [Burkholderia phage BcepSaruman]QBX06773.1 hypothetical protein BcepSaruman_360 [Burkholderia phage BcepSaruman]